MAKKFVELSAEELNDDFTVADLTRVMTDAKLCDMLTAMMISNWLGGGKESALQAPENLARWLAKSLRIRGDDVNVFMKDWLDANVKYIVDCSEEEYGGTIEYHLLWMPMKDAFDLYISVAKDGTCYSGMWCAADEHLCLLSDEVCSAINRARELGACGGVETLYADDLQHENEAWGSAEGMADFVEWAVGTRPETTSTAQEFVAAWLSRSVQRTVSWPDGETELRLYDSVTDGLYLSMAPDGSCTAGTWEGAESLELPLSEKASGAVAAAYRSGACGDAEAWAPKAAGEADPAELAAGLEQRARKAADAGAAVRSWLKDHAYGLAKLPADDDGVAAPLEVLLMNEYEQRRLGYELYLAIRPDGSCASCCRSARTGEAAEVREQALPERLSELVLGAAQKIWPANPEQDWDPWAGYPQVAEDASNDGTGSDGKSAGKKA